MLSLDKKSQTWIELSYLQQNQYLDIYNHSVLWQITLGSANYVEKSDKITIIK